MEKKAYALHEPRPWIGNMYYVHVKNERQAINTWGGSELQYEKTFHDWVDKCYILHERFSGLHYSSRVFFNEGHWSFNMQLDHVTKITPPSYWLELGQASRLG